MNLNFIGAEKYIQPKPVVVAALTFYHTYLSLTEGCVLLLENFAVRRKFRPQSTPTLRQAHLEVFCFH